MVLKVEESGVIDIEIKVNLSDIISVGIFFAIILIQLLYLIWGSTLFVVLCPTNPNFKLRGEQDRSSPRSMEASPFSSFVSP